MQCRPKPIARTGEMMTGGRGIQSWIDSTEQNPQASGNHIRQALVKMSPEQQREVLQAEKITWKLLHKIRQVDVERSWDDLDLPDIDDGGATRPTQQESECPSAKRYNGSSGCLHAEMLKDTIAFFEGRTGRPSSWKAAAEAIRGLWNMEKEVDD